MMMLQQATLSFLAYSLLIIACRSFSFSRSVSHRSISMHSHSGIASSPSTPPRPEFNPPPRNSATIPSHLSRLVYTTNSDRIAINKALSQYLFSDRRDMAVSLLQFISENGWELEADTVNLLLKDSFQRRDIRGIEEIFNRYFGSGKVKPSTRTLNLLLEGFRSIAMATDATTSDICTQKALSYYNLLTSSSSSSSSFSSTFKVQPDTYTYSSLIRLADSAEAVLGLLSAAFEQVQSTITPPLSSSTSSSSSSSSSLHLSNCSTAILPPPLIRCAIESLGKRGAPLAALAVAASMLSANDSTCTSPDSGDSIIVALLHDPYLVLTPPSLLPNTRSSLNVMENDVGNAQVEANNGNSILSQFNTVSETLEKAWNFHIESMEKQGLLSGKTCGDLALQLILATDTDTDTDTNTVTNTDTDTKVENSEYQLASSILQNWPSKSFPTSIKCSTKGFCVLFSYLQASLLDITTTYDLPMTDKIDACMKLERHRDSLWKLAKSSIISNEGILKQLRQLNLGITQNQNQTVNHTTMQGNFITQAPRSHNVKINGRLCDAILRCFLRNPEEAKLTWKREILPIVQRLDVLKSGIFNETALKAMEALMFVNACNGRADLALEIALTARRRGWSATTKKLLANSYSLGRQIYTSSPTRTASLTFGKITNDVLESSIEAELGTPVYDRDGRWPIQRIRFQFKKPSPSSSSSSSSSASSSSSSSSSSSIPSSSSTTLGGATSGSTRPASASS